MELNRNQLKRLIRENDWCNTSDMLTYSGILRTTNNDGSTFTVKEVARMIKGCTSGDMTEEEIACELTIAERISRLYKWSDVLCRRDDDTALVWVTEFMPDILSYESLKTVASCEQYYRACECFYQENTVNYHASQA